MSPCTRCGNEEAQWHEIGKAEPCARMLGEGLSFYSQVGWEVLLGARLTDHGWGMPRGARRGLVSADLHRQTKKDKHNQ